MGLQLKGVWRRAVKARRWEALRSSSIVFTRTTTTIGTWNVQTMHETGLTAQVAAEMSKPNLTILGISESRCLEATDFQRVTFLFGHEQETPTFPLGSENADPVGGARSTYQWTGAKPVFRSDTFSSMCT
ncbi:hypothetical protein DPMN_048308 [Dreissena polymorpha]|uniref:Uncharacterized protein n=1 Tax=Dreissena polymorpha TaxID=45954 RepID=A0A9D4D9R3_DREPO|nr:hypothetical protein DPMN_048308 [Dreissena polymorpha]